MTVLFFVAALLLWPMVMLGGVYLMVNAKITKTARELLVVWRTGLASVLSCEWCSSFWSGMFSYIVLLTMAETATSFPQTLALWLISYLSAPAFGVAAIGIVDWLHKKSPSVAALRLAKEVKAILIQKQEEEGSSDV